MRPMALSIALLALVALGGCGNPSHRTNRQVPVKFRGPPQMRLRLKYSWTTWRALCATETKTSTRQS